jgi:hypothetical protein
MLTRPQPVSYMSPPIVAIPELGTSDRMGSDLLGRDVRSGLDRFATEANQASVSADWVKLKLNHQQIRELAFVASGSSRSLVDG